MDTVFALSTPPGKGGVAVIRISGPDINAVLNAFELKDVPLRRAALRTLKFRGEVLDQALVLRFARGASFTGEESLEFQIHGSSAVQSGVLQALSQIEGCRQAEAGEFTRRALENGQMDLAEVEGLADLIEAETEAQRRQAQRVFSGGLQRLADGWRAELIEALALLEVTIDFADEEVPVDVGPDVLSLLQNVISELGSEIDGVSLAERVRAGFEVAIVGAPNAGKSTLLNALAGRKAALTSEVAGTTRDVIEVRMDLDGLPVTFLDTAGLRATEDAVEAMGVDLAAERARGADLRVFLRSYVDTPDLVELRVGDIDIWGKGDLEDAPEGAISGLTGKGLDELISRISSELADRTQVIGIATHDRHRGAMKKARGDLESAVDLVQRGSEVTELAAQEIRSALACLDRLVGRVDVEDILDHIFSRFCLGK